MANQEAAGLFGAAGGDAATGAAAAARGAKHQKTDKDEKRVMLRPWDTAAAQVLNPYGRSSVIDMSQAELWKAVAEGSAKARFHTELAATTETGGNYRVGIGLSRMAGTYLANIEELRKSDVARLLKQEPLQLALAEAEHLEPSLKILYAGKGSQFMADSAAIGFGRVRQERSKQKDGPKHSQEEVEKAAADMHAFLSKPTSPLRAIMSILSGGGVFYAGNVIDKVGRAWVAHKPAGVDDAKTAAVARASGAGAPVDSGIEDDSKGLFGS